MEQERLNITALSKVVTANPEGFTAKWTGQQPKLNGYVVAVSDRQTKPQRIKATLKELFKVAKTLNTASYIGGWLDAKTGLFYLDISLNLQNRAEAETIGRVFKQKAIFDIEKLETIAL